MLPNSEVFHTSSLREYAAQGQLVTTHSKEASVTPERSWSLPGFGAGARVETSIGPLPIEALRRRDTVKTREGRTMQVHHVDAIRLDRRFLLTHPDAQPVELQKNALAPGCPSDTILLSGAQKMSRGAGRGQPPVMDAADCIELGKAERRLHGYFTYYLFHCGEPCTVNINGLWVHLDPESLEPPGT